jgi:2,3-bisphosphoglycerate-dependent phosphoglycerate mutase
MIEGEILTNTELIFVRHGQTDWNAEGRIQGHIGPGLNALGRQQANEAAQALTGERIDAIYSSDLARARETAEIIGRAVGVSITEDMRLRERAHGDWEAKTTAELDAQVPNWRELWRRVDLDMRAPGGESTRQVVARVTPMLEEIAAAHPNGRVIIVTHGGVIGTIRTIAANTPHGQEAKFGTKNCEIVPLKWPMQIAPEEWVALYGGVADGLR